MKQTLQLGLEPNAEQATTLHDVMREFNAAANHAAKVGFSGGVFTQAAIHKLCYRELREKFGLSAQLAVRAIGKAVEVFVRDKTILPVFRSKGAITYDDHCLSFKKDDIASILTRSGRVLVPIVYGKYQQKRLDLLKGQVDLVLKNGLFYLHAIMEQPALPPSAVKDFIGVDLGVVNLAATSDGDIYSGAKVKEVRQRRTNRRRRLQKEASRQRKRGKRPRSVRRALKRLGNKEARFRRHENHCISKK